ncbi:MAG: polysaccharide biosynthesis C-terminal domain-containing protein, partial [Chloroflexota bacterium]|nr:polysaccharide biosynthesis C-terminal domain-containing protein [Chloroflexota bacterium]
RVGRPRLSLIWLVLGFGVVSMIGGTASNQTLIWARKFIIDDLGPGANGLFSVVNALSYQILNLVLIALGSYSYARISTMRDHGEIAREVNYTLRAMMLPGVALLFVVSVFRGLIVPALFTQAFLGGAALIPMQAVGDFLKITLWVLHLPQLPMGRKRAYLGYLLLWCGLFVGISFICLKLFGLFGVVYAHVSSHLIVSILLYFDQRRNINLHFTPENWRLLASSLVLLLSVVIFNSEEAYLYPLFIAELMLWAALNITPGERTQLLGIVRTRLRPAG